MEDFPIADWVFQVAEGQAEYHTKRTGKKAKEEFFNSKK